MPSLQEKAEEVYRLYQNSPLSSHPVVALSELSTLCANSCPDERTFYLVLLQLQKEKRVTVLEQNGEKVWKHACLFVGVCLHAYMCMLVCAWTHRDLICCPMPTPGLVVNFSACVVETVVICSFPPDCEVCQGATCQSVSCERCGCWGLPADAERTASLSKG